MNPITTLLHSPRWRRCWAALLALLLTVISWLALRPATQVSGPAGLDKLEHWAAFAALAGAALLAQVPSRRAAAWAAAGLLLYGVFIELVQAFLPTRSADVADVLADAVGIAFGLGLTLLLRRRWAPPATG